MRPRRDRDIQPEHRDVGCGGEHGSGPELTYKRHLIDVNPLQGFEPFEGGQDERHVRRGAFSEAEIRAILAAARPQQRALIALLALTGLRPGEAFALDWSAVDLEGGSLRVERSWDPKARQYVDPKTDAGKRIIPLSGQLVAELKAHRDLTGGTGYVFANGKGKPLNPSNVRLRLWIPLLKRAGVRQLDMYSLRHSFASLGCTAGESAFNVARMMGHARSTLADQVYAHSMQSGMSSVAERVTARTFGDQPKLRVVSREGREPVETAPPVESKDVASV